MICQNNPKFLTNDCTNAYERYSFICLIIIQSLIVALLFRVLYNIRKWAMQHQLKNQQRKLYCINSILLLNTFVRIFSFIIAPTGQGELDHFKLFVYNILMSINIILMNMTFIIASKIWMKLIQKCHYRYHNAKVFKFLNYVLTGGWIIIMIFLILENFLDYGSEIGRYTKVICQIVGSLIFGVCGYFFYDHIYDVYEIKSEFKWRVKYGICGLIFSNFVRLSFNYIMTLDLIYQIKCAGVDGVDQGPYWAVFIFMWSVLSDGVPTLLLSYYFSPLARPKKLQARGRSDVQSIQSSQINTSLMN